MGMFDLLGPLSPMLGPAIVPVLGPAIEQFSGGFNNDPGAYANGGPQIGQHADHPNSILGTLGQGIGDLGRGIGQEGLGGLLDPAGMLDRQAAQRELRSGFDIVPDSLIGPRLPNQISEAEFEKQAHVFSDIRMGRSDMKFDASCDQTYRDGTMKDMASMLQTNSGRELVDSMADNTAGEKSLFGFGPAKHHTTTLMPYLKADGTPDQSNSDELGLNVHNHNDQNGQGVNAQVRYNPGLDVGTPGSQAWWPARSDVILTHELTHAYYDTHGTTDNGMVNPVDGDGVAGNVGAYKGSLQRYEHQAAGLGHYANATVGENAYRSERASIGGGKGTRAGDAGMAHRDFY